MAKSGKRAIEVKAGQTALSTTMKPRLIAAGRSEKFDKQLLRWIVASNTPTYAL